MLRHIYTIFIMKNLERPKIDCFNEFELILSSKIPQTQNILEKIKSQIKNRYLEYDVAFEKNKLSQISQVIYNGQLKKELLSCYSNKTVQLDNLIVRIKQAQIDYIKSTCQYCGIDSDDSTDHYLPKGKFPEFCIKQLNLIPCCPTCNSLKGQSWLDKESLNRVILNLYSDILTTSQYVFVKLNYNKTKKLFNAKFSLENRCKIDDSLFELIENHFKKLKLLKRYENKFGTIFSQIVSVFDKGKLFKNNPSLVQEILFNEAISLMEKQGNNYYKAIIKMELSKNENFLNMF